MSRDPVTSEFSQSLEQLQQLAKGPLSFMFALPMARAYADLGLVAYNKLAIAFEQAQAEQKSFSNEVMTESIAAAMVLSFAAELFIKVLAYQRTGEYPRGHDLTSLIEKVPEDVRRKIKSGYEGRVARNVNVLKFEYKFAVNSTEPTPPAVFQGPTPPDDWPGHTFEEAIALASPLFIKLRYLYEEVTDGFIAVIDFRWLIYLVDALQVEIYTYTDGNVKITS